MIANTLRVLPGAPMSIELIAKTDHSLHVGWRPPQDPHQHITQYRLSWQSLAQPGAPRQSKLVDHPKLDYLIDGLEPETMYNISLSAGTPHGFGPEIWAQFRTDPFKVPAVLQAPIVTPEGAHTLHVEWIGVVDTQNRVAGYIVEIRTSDAPQWTESTGVVSACQNICLRKGHCFLPNRFAMSRVAAITALGWTDWNRTRSTLCASRWWTIGNESAKLHPKRMPAPDARHQRNRRLGWLCTPRTGAKCVSIGNRLANKAGSVRPAATRWSTGMGVSRQGLWTCQGKKEFGIAHLIVAFAVG